MKRKRLWLVITTVIAVLWLYITPLNVYSATYGKNFYCEPLSAPLSEGEHYFRYTPSRNSNQLWDLIDDRYSPKSNSEMYQYLDRETKAWTRGCDIARDNRKVLLNIILVVFAVLFFWLPKDPQRQSEEISQADNESSKIEDDTEDADEPHNGGHCHTSNRDSNGPSTSTDSETPTKRGEFTT